MLAPHCFCDGWFLNSFGIYNLILLNQNKLLSGNFGHNDNLILDLSQPDTVKLYNRSDLRYRDISNNINDFAQGVLEVDISGLKEEKFVPGCASAQAKINAYIFTFDKNINLKFPQGLAVEQDKNFDQIRQNIMKDSTNAYLNEISNARNTLDSVKVLTTLYGEMEGNDLALEAVLLNTKLTNRNKKAIISIIYDNDKLFLDNIKSLTAEMLAKYELKRLEDHSQESNLKELVSYIAINKTEDNSDLDKIILEIQKLIQEKTINPSDPESFEVISLSPIADHNALQESLAVRNYCILESDQEKHLKFASKRLEKYCKEHDIIQIDKSTINNLEEACISILTPICKNDHEKQLLKNSVTTRIQEFTNQQGTMDYITTSISYILTPLTSLWANKDVEKNKFVDSTTIG